MAERGGQRPAWTPPSGGKEAFAAANGPRQFVRALGDFAKLKQLLGGLEGVGHRAGEISDAEGLGGTEVIDAFITGQLGGGEQAVDGVLHVEEVAHLVAGRKGHGRAFGEPLQEVGK